MLPPSAGILIVFVAKWTVGSSAAVDRCRTQVDHQTV